MKIVTGALAMAMILGSLSFCYAGAIPPKVLVDSVPARSVDAHNVVFRGGSEAIVYIEGDGDTDLDLYVYDAYGRLVGCDEDYTDRCVVRFVPRSTGNYSIQVKNRGDVYNRYLFMTN